MSKILLHLENDRFLEIVNLHRVWITYSYYWKLYLLVYSDDIYEYKVIYYSESVDVLLPLKEKLVNAYSEGKTSLDL